MLEKVLGPGQAIVRVSAEINYDTLSKTEEKFDPDGQVMRSQTKNDENNDSSTAAPSGPVGISANTSTDTNSAASTPVSNTKNRRALTTVQYEIGKTTSSQIQAAGGIKRLSAAVTIAAKMEGVGADRKIVSRAPEEIEKLRRIVTSALGIQTGNDNLRGDTVALEELPFNDQFATDMAQDLVQQQKHDMWWNIARSAGYPALGLLALLILWRLFKRTPIQEIPLGVPVGRLLGGHHGAAGGHGSGAEPEAVVTVEVLNRLIKENPVNMTQAIREWMDKERTPQA
jgi:flagellar M-ring protein FliF